MYSAKSGNNRSVLSSLILAAVLSILLSTSLVGRVGAVSGSGGTTIGALVCGPSSTITLTKPASDSIVTSSIITLEGTVNQTNQIEIYVDESFRGVMSIDLGQSQFTGEVQITTGTHTIEVRAVNICSGPNGKASSVVTYSPESKGPSNGSETPTNTGGVTAPGVVQPVDNTSSPTLVENFLAPLIDLAKWLNIGLNDSGDIANPRLMSPREAVSLFIGLILLIFGVSKRTVIRYSRVPIIGQVKPLATLLRRRRLLSICVRLLGLSLLLWSLFL